MRLFSVVLSAALVAGASGVVFANPPSFDCSLAQTPDEIAVCADPELSALDVVGAKGFAYVVRTYGRPRATEVGRPFLRARNACGGDASCIRGAQTAAIMAWQSLGAPISLPDSADTLDEPLPQSIGDCSQARIANIEGRLNGDRNFESGTVVIFTNRGSQVSYDYEAAIIGSQVGDPVTICLVHIPSNCPPGDDRGRVYQTTNQRSGSTWTLPDAEHECGGA